MVSNSPNGISVTSSGPSLKNYSQRSIWKTRSNLSKPTNPNPPSNKSCTSGLKRPHKPSSYRNSLRNQRFTATVSSSTRLSGVSLWTCKTLDSGSLRCRPRLTQSCKGYWALLITGGSSCICSIGSIDRSRWGSKKLKGTKPSPKCSISGWRQLFWTRGQGYTTRQSSPRNVLAPSCSL